MKQTPVCVLCDWLISNSTSKDDVERWMLKDSHYACNTEHGYKMAGGIWMLKLHVRLGSVFHNRVVFIFHSLLIITSEATIAQLQVSECVVSCQHLSKTAIATWIIMVAFHTEMF